MKRLVIPGDEPVLTPGEVAAAFKISPNTVIKWANEGKLPSFRTLGNHRRFRRSAVEALLNGEAGNG